MRGKFCVFNVTAFLIQLTVLLCVPAVRAQDFWEGRIVVTVLSPKPVQGVLKPDSWTIDLANHLKVQVSRSEKLSSAPETLLVIDAERLQENDLPQIRDFLMQVQKNPEPDGQAAKIAWVEGGEWKWLSAEAVPTRLGRPSKRQQDSLEAAIFLDRFREILSVSQSGETPRQIVLMTRDFLVPELMTEPTPQSDARRSIPSQCFDSVVAALTNQPSRLKLINFSPEQGYLTHLTEIMGGSVRHETDPECCLQSVDLEDTYLLTLLSSFEGPENSLPNIPVQPLRIQIRNREQEWVVQAPRLLWPLPPGLPPPTLSELLEAEQLRSRVQSLTASNDPVQALVLSRKIVRLEPFDLHERMRTLQLLKTVEHPDPRELERSVDEALMFFPDSLELCYQKGLVAEEGGRTTEAVRWYERAMKLDGARRDISLTLASLYLKTEQWEPSILCFERIIGTESDSASVRVGYAKALWKTGSSEKAQAQLTVAREMHPGHMPALELEMRFALESKDYRQALKLARNILDFQPDLPAANLTAGLALTGLQRCKDALPYLEAADSDPYRDNFELQYGLYECLLDQERLDEAIHNLARAANLRSKTPEIWITLARLHERRGNQEAANEALKRGTETNVDDPRFHLSLSTWWERHGEGAKALIALEKALSLARGQERAEFAQRYVLLALQENGTDAGLEQASGKLDPELDNHLLQMLQARRETQDEENSARETRKGMVLPGGFEPLLNYAPFLKSRIQDEDLLDLLFGYLLETEPLKFANQRVVQSNPRRDETTNFYREVLRFESWLEQEVGSKRIHQPITTEESDLEPANRVLSYFGVKVRKPKQGRPTYTPDPDSLPKLEVVVEPRYERRRTVLKWYGVNTNLMGEGSVLEFELKDANVPILMGVDYWNRNIFKLNEDQQEKMLLRWLENPQAMKLYRALAKLPPPARERLVGLLTIDQLLEEITPGLLSMGDLLKFDDHGRIVLPGGDQAVSLWSRLVRISLDDEESFIRKLFTRDEGKALYYLASLSQQKATVLDFLMSESTRFERLYGFLPPPPKGNFLAGRPARNFNDTADILAMLQTDGKEVFFPASWDQSSASLSQETGRFAGDDKLIRSLFDTAGNGAPPHSAKKYAMLTGLSLYDSPLLSGAPERLLDLGALYGLVADLGLNSESVENLLQRTESIEMKVSQSDRRTVIALFQAPLVILRTLVHNQVLEREKVPELAALLISSEPDSWLPGDVALTVTPVLVELTQLLENRYGPGQPLELLLKAFADRHELISFLWNGRVRKIDLAQREVEQMHNCLDEHYVASLDSVLAALQVLTDLSDTSEAIVEQMDRSVQPLLSAEMSWSYLSDRYRRAVQHTNAQRLQTALNNFRREFLYAGPENRKNASTNLSHELAPYLAEALIALVYVRSIKGDDLVVQTDEHFFRKHAFEETSFALGSHGPHAMGGSWGQPILVKDHILGSRIVGSLAGISRPLARLKAEQLHAQSSTRFADSTFPVTQKLAVALVDSLSLKDEALDWAGTTIDLARKVIAASIIDTKLRPFVFASVDRLCGPVRSWQVRQNIQKGDLTAALHLLLPSELFQLGKEHWISRSPGASPEAAEFWFFQQQPSRAGGIPSTWENELGFPLTTVVGIDILSLDHPGSIESSSTYNSPHRLAERCCELKLHMAQLFWKMGLPSPLFKLVCDKILDRVLPRVGQVDREDWRAITGELLQVNEDDVRAVLSELFDE